MFNKIEKLAKCQLSRRISRREKILLLILNALIISAVVIFLPTRLTGHPQKKIFLWSKTKSSGLISSTAAPVDISGFGLQIDKISVWAPIIANVDEGNEASYLSALENGIALGKDLAKSPNENGSMFLFGHSRYYKNKAGSYKEVFKDLNKLSAGDKFTVFYKMKSYNYEVTDSKEVAKDDFSIRDATPGDPNDKTISIMTCWPPGTTDYRWIIFAKQI